MKQDEILSKLSTMKGYIPPFLDILSNMEVYQKEIDEKLNKREKKKDSRLLEENEELGRIIESDDEGVELEKIIRDLEKESGVSSKDLKELYDDEEEDVQDLNEKEKMTED